MVTSSQPDSLERAKPVPSGKPVASDLLLQEFDSLADTVGAVAKLRRLILRLAVEGQLLPTERKPESAQGLLERLETARLRAVAEGSAPKQKPSPIPDAEKFVPMAPKHWVWVRLNQLGWFAGGATPSMANPRFWDGGVPWVTPKDMKSPVVQRSEMSVTDLALKETRLRRFPKQSILIVARSGILKRTLPVSVSAIECTVNQDLKVIVPFLPELSAFVRLMLCGHEAYILEHLVKGGMTVQSLKYEEFEQQAFPLPPLPEQRRIVAKVEELLALCDELESRQTTACKHHTRLVHSALDHLTAAKDEQDFRKQCSFILHNSSLILDSVPALRQAILSLAAQGRLVPQNQNDEPALALLSKVRKSNQRLTESAGKKPPKDWPKVEPDEMTFNLPNGWVATRLGNLAANIEAGSSPHWSLDVFSWTRGPGWRRTWGQWNRSASRAARSRAMI